MKYYTFVMLKPDTLRRNLGPESSLMAEVTHMLTEKGFRIEFFTLRTVTAENIAKHYHKLAEPYKTRAVAALTGKQVIPMILSSDSPSIIGDVRKLVGATDPSAADEGTIRRKHGVDSYEKSTKEARFCENLIHASDSDEGSFETEIKIWFSEKELKLLNLQ